MTTTKADEFTLAEEPARALLQKLGWCFVPSDVLAAEREYEREVILKNRLRKALLRLNEWMTAEQADRVIFDLEHLDGFGMARNQLVHEYLIYGKPLAVDSPTSRMTRNVRFFDFDYPDTGLNDLVVTTQFRVAGSGKTIIPDLVLFGNGIPLVVMEAKAPSLLGWKTEAVNQLLRYQKYHPELFHYNLLNVVHCGVDAAFGALNAPEEYYVGWKSLAPYTEAEVERRFEANPTVQTHLIVGLLTPATVLDILRDYVVYEPEQGRIIKKLPRYQQYRAVTSAIERIRSGSEPTDRGGVVWHTQGSGKSLTMLWLATKLRREAVLSNPTIVVVTDRIQLDSQITSTFRRCGFQAPEQARDGRHLRRMLTAGQGRTVMTTIFKFDEAMATHEGESEPLDSSENVVVMVDEAHRTQYGLLGGRMSQALPKATLIGFTGTPIEKDYKRSTIGRFGPLIDSYTIPQSVADGVTVPIHYQARMPELAIEGPVTLDKLFDTMFENQPDDVQQEIRRRYANKETVSEAERRIEMIALNIADHFKAHVRPNGFKAQVVAPSRLAAIRYAGCLNDFGVSTYPIITTDAKDGPEFGPARELNQDQIISAYRDPEGEPQILVVVDMLLTGFDAPVEQVLYLDRNLRDHGLLQAIARVNRRFSHERNGATTEKTHGLVVDYHGVSANLEEALRTFDTADVQEAMRELAEDPGPLVEAAAGKAEAYFDDLDLDDLWSCVLIFAPDAHTEGNLNADLYAAFDTDYRAFSRIMDQYLPDPKALAFVDRLARLTRIRACVRAQYLRENASVDWTGIGAKVKHLVDQRIGATEVRDLMAPLSILNENFRYKIAQIPDDKARASVMEKAVRARIKARKSGNPAFYQKLSQHLDRIIEELRNRLIDAAEACRRMADLIRQESSEGDVAARLGLSDISFAVYGLLDQADEEAKDLSRNIEDVIEEGVQVVDWHTNPETKRIMRRDIKRLLRGTRHYTNTQIEEKATQMLRLAEARQVTAYRP